MRRGAALILLLATLATALQAAPSQSPRPLARPGAPSDILPDPVVARLEGPEPSTPRPQPRPVEDDSGARADPVPAGRVPVSPHPEERPENLKRRAIIRAAGFVPAPLPQGPRDRGAGLCGVPGIKGEPVSPILPLVSGCGLSGGVRVTAVDEIRLTPPATVDCPTARALADWLRHGAVPAVGRRGGGITEIKVAASYVCRPRNNVPGARISEHGSGRAVDIGAITLKNGAQLTVLTGWSDRGQGPVLKAMYGRACGMFGTVLGPTSDAHHKDHFHFDTAQYRSGPYCR